MKNQVQFIDWHNYGPISKLCQLSSARRFTSWLWGVKVKVFIIIIISLYIYISFTIAPRKFYYTDDLDQEMKNGNVSLIKEGSPKEAFQETGSPEQLFGLNKCASVDEYPLFIMWSPVKCPDESSRIILWAIQRGMMARELKMVAAALLSNDVNDVGGLPTKSFLTAVMAMNPEERSQLAHFLKEAANRLLRWRVVDVGANKGYLLAEVIEVLLGHFQQTDRDYITNKSRGKRVARKKGGSGTVDAKLPLGATGTGDVNEEINKYTSRSLALSLFTQYDIQRPSKRGRIEASLSIRNTNDNAIISSYRTISRYSLFKICGACCDCGKIRDRTLEKVLLNVGRTTKGDGDGKGSRSIEDLTRYRPQQLEIHAYEPTIANYRWLSHFYNPTTTRRSTASESPPSSSHYLRLGGNRLNISIYNMGVGKTSRSGAVKGGDNRSDRSTSVAYFPIVSLGEETGRVQFTPSPEHRAVSLTSLDEHLLPILKQREGAIRDDKFTSALFPSLSKKSVPDSKSETIHPHTSDLLYFPIDVLYTDTEGFDEYVAQGADFLLSNNMVAAYQFEIHFVTNYTAVFDKLSSYNYVCYFETESLKGGNIPKLIRITHGCWRKEYERLSGWMNALCYHTTLLKDSGADIRDMEGFGRNKAIKKTSSRIDWESLISKKDPNHLTIDINSELSRKWAGSLLLKPLRGIFDSLEESYHNKSSMSCNYRKRRKKVRR